MGKYGPEITQKICDLIVEDSYTIPEICQKAGISETTYHEWKKDKTEFSEALKKARERATAHRLAECRNSLKKLINGYDYEEITEVAEGGKVAKRTVTRKHIAPNLGAIIHYQANRDPYNWSNKQFEKEEDDGSKVEFIINENMIPHETDTPESSAQMSE